MKRSIGLTIGMFVVPALLLSGCGGAKSSGNTASSGSSNTTNSSSSNTTGSSSSNTTNSSSSTPSTTKPVTITWWNRVSGMQNIVPEFEKTHPNIHIKFRQLPVNQYQTIFTDAVKSNSLPDVFTSPGITSTKLVSLNKVHSLNSIFPQSAIDKYPAGTFAPGSNSPKVGNTIYEVPIYSDFNASYMMYYNKDVLKKYGINTIPKTWQELMAVGKEIYQKSHGKAYGLIIGGKAAWLSSSVIAQLAHAISPNEGFDYTTGQYNYAATGVSQTIQYFKNLYDSKALDPNSLDVTPAQAGADFAVGKDAFFIDGPWEGSTLVGDKFTDWDVAPIPTKDGKKQFAQFSGGINAGVYASQNTKHWPQVKTFLEWLRDNVDSYVIQQCITVPPKKFSEIKPVTPEFPQFNNIVKIANSLWVKVPTPAARNLGTIDVNLAFRNLAPKQSLGNILEGYLTGQVKDLNSTLTKYNDATNKAFDQAIQKSNGKVTKKTYIYSDWDPTQPYTK